MRKHLILVVACLLVCDAAYAAGKRALDKCTPERLEAIDFPLSKLAPEASEKIARQLKSSPDDIIVRRLVLDPYRKARVDKGFQEDLVDANVSMDIDAAPFLTYARQLALSKVPRTCRVSASPGTPHMTVVETKLLVTVPTTVEVNICGSFTAICCKRLKCRKCQTDFRTKLFQKSVNVDFTLTPKWEPQLDLVPTATISGVSGWENEIRKALNQVLEIFTTKFDDAAFGLSSIANDPWLNDLRETLPALVHLSGSTHKSLEDLENQLGLSGFAFHEVDGKVVLRISKVRREMRRTAYCPAQRQVRETIAYLDSFHRGTECVQVAPGGGFWAIADRSYGNGECGRALAQLHRRRTGTDRALRAGDSVLVPPMHRLLGPEPSVAVVGMSETREGLSASDGRTADVERTFLEDRDRANPDLIYPCQFVRAGDSPTLETFLAEASCPALAPGASTED